MRVPSPEEIVNGNRAALARAITLAESTRPEDRSRAAELIDQLLPHTGRARRIGVSGAPGVGKSSTIEVLGLHLVEAGERLAVLAIDPSSRRTGGSILGDRTRMIELSRHPDAYIRSSPSAGSLGGVAARTGDALLLCEAAGCTTVLVETVGVGQSETAVADLTDLFLLLVAPGGGDDLQGIKRGVMEIADVISVNKADGATREIAETTAADYRAALSLVRPKWPGHPTEVLTCSAQERSRIDDLWRVIADKWADLDRNGALAGLRTEQAVRSLRQQVALGINELLMTRDHAEAAERLETEVRAGRRSPSSAADSLVSALARAMPTSG